jgi:hypothetical protein
MHWLITRYKLKKYDPSIGLVMPERERREAKEKI